MMYSADEVCGDGDGVFGHPDDEYRTPSPLPSRPTQLVKAIFDKAKAVEDNEASELIRVLCRILEGKDPLRAIGAPGDWGYGTPIGDALKGEWAVLKRMQPVTASSKVATDLLATAAAAADSIGHVLGNAAAPKLGRTHLMYLRHADESLRAAIAKANGGER